MALFVFGDSHTEGYKNDLGFPPYKQYRKYLGVKNSKQLPPIWSELLAEKLNIPSHNHAKGGSSNHEILLRFSNICHEIKKDDIVIINWTHVQRCLWVTEPESEDIENYITSISPYQNHQNDRAWLFKDAYDIISINRMHFSWTYEVLYYQNIIDTISNLIGFKTYYWFTDDYLYDNFKKIENVNQDKYLLNDLISTYNPNTNTKKYQCIPFNIIQQYGGTTLYDETLFVEDNIHLGGDGHKVQAELFYCYLTKTKYPNYNKTLI